MKRNVVLLLLAGLALVAFLIARAEFHEIILAFRRMGLGGYALLVAIQLVLAGVLGCAWGVLADPAQRGPIFVAARLLRDGAAEVLPLSQIGGFVLGARALVLARLSAGFAAGSTVVDVTLELIAQLIYTLAGVSILVVLRPQSPLALPALAAIAAMAVLAVVFVAAQRRGAGVIDRLMTRAALHMMGPRETAEAGVQSEIHHIHTKAPRLVAGLALHLLTWCSVGAETWLILWLIGAQVGFAEALVIHSLVSGVRSMAFMVPQALGVQEGGYIMMGAMFGVPAEAALALSLVRRARDLTIGVPVLLLWQVIEGRRLTRR
jgi:putative membrane protein